MSETLDESVYAQSGDQISVTRYCAKLGLIAYQLTGRHGYIQVTDSDLEELLHIVREHMKLRAR